MAILIILSRFLDWLTYTEGRGMAQKPTAHKDTSMTRKTLSIDADADTVASVLRLLMDGGMMQRTGVTIVLGDEKPGGLSLTSSSGISAASEQGAVTLTSSVSSSCNHRWSPVGDGRWACILCGELWPYVDSDWRKFDLPRKPASPSDPEALF